MLAGQLSFEGIPDPEPKPAPRPAFTPEEIDWLAMGLASCLPPRVPSTPEEIAARRLKRQEERRR